MSKLVRIMQIIKKLLMLKSTKSQESVLSRKIKISGKQENKFKKGASSVLSTKLH